MPDRDLLVADELDVPPYVLGNRLVRGAVGACNAVARAYWHLIRPLL